MEICKQICFLDQMDDKIENDLNELIMDSDSEKQKNYVECKDINKFNWIKDISNNIYSSNNKKNILIKEFNNKTEEKSIKIKKKIIF